MAEKRQRGLREMWSLTVTNKKKKKDAAALCARVLLAALDHNMHSFRPQATSDQQWSPNLQEAVFKEN
ncbi:hypothetical protein ABFA07_008029 [Porites harrisoni]